MDQVNLTISGNLFAPDGGAIAHELLEQASLEAYRNGVISIGRLAEILQLSIYEAHGFLKAHGTYVNLSDEEIEQGTKMLDALLSRQ